MGANNNYKLTSAGIDYLSLTVRRSERNYAEIHDTILGLMVEMQPLGAKLTTKKQVFFDGYGVKGLFLGFRDQWMYIQSSGGVSRETADRIRKVGGGGKCSRIDFQVTAKYPAEQSEFNSRLRAQLRGFEARNTERVRVPLASYEDRDRDTGITYGDRGSSRYNRIYHAASGGHADSGPTEYRFEAEFRKGVSRAAWKQFLGGGNQQALAASFVVGECLSHGIQEPWFGATVPESVPGEWYTGDDESYRAWIVETVVPSIRKRVGEPSLRAFLLDTLDSLYWESASSGGDVVTMSLAD